MDLDWGTVFLLLGSAGLAEVVARAPMFEGLQESLKSKSFKCAHCMGFVFGVLVYFLYYQLWYWTPLGWLLMFVFGGLASLVALIFDTTIFFVKVRIECSLSEMAFMEKNKMREENKKKD